MVTSLPAISLFVVQGCWFEMPRGVVLASHPALYFRIQKSKSVSVATLSVKSEGAFWISDSLVFPGRGGGGPVSVRQNLQYGESR